MQRRETADSWLTHPVLKPGPTTIRFASLPTASSSRLEPAARQPPEARNAVRQRRHPLSNKIAPNFSNKPVPQDCSQGCGSQLTRSADRQSRDSIPTTLPSFSCVAQGVKGRVTVGTWSVPRASCTCGPHSNFIYNVAQIILQSCTASANFPAVYTYQQEKNPRARVNYISSTKQRSLQHCSQHDN